MEITNIKKEKSMRSKIERTLVIVDLENLAGGSEFVGQKSQSIRGMISDVNEENKNTLTIVATGVGAINLCPEVLWHWADSRFLIGSGVGGADRELLNVLSKEPIAESTSRIQIWSGDHCFAPISRKLKRLGCAVEIFANEGSLSRELGAAATVTRIIKSSNSAIDPLSEDRIETAIELSACKQETKLFLHPNELTQCSGKSSRGTQKFLSIHDYEELTVERSVEGR